MSTSMCAGRRNRTPRSPEGPAEQLEKTPGGGISVQRVSRPTTRAECGPPSLQVPADGATGADAAKVRYALNVRVEGAPTQDVMHSKLEALQKAFKDLEH